MGYREIKKLFAESAGRCNFPECKKILFYEYKDKSFVSLGEVCHIIGESQSGPRGDPKFSKILENEEKNLILLCPEHHKIIDGNPEEYLVEKLKKMKKEHIKWVSNRLDISQDTNWTLIIHSGNINGTGLSNIDEELIFKDFFGTYLITNVEKIEVPEFLVESNNWLNYKEKQKIWWENYQKQHNKPMKFVICSINFIPLVIHLGYLLHDTSLTEVHQFNRAENTWTWQIYKKTEKQVNFFKIENELKENLKIDKLALAFCISSNIRNEDVFEVLGNNIEILKINVEKTNRNWLKFKEHLVEFQNFFIEFIDNLNSFYPKLSEIHLFYAGPTPTAFIIGNSINPNMHPKFVLYNFHLKNKPKYQRVFSLE